MSFGSVFLQPPLVIDPGCYALFWLKRTIQGALTPVHVGIVTINEPTTIGLSTTVQLQEWPLDHTHAFCVEPIKPATGVAVLTLGLATHESELLLIGWKGPAEPGTTPDRKKVFSAAWNILVAADRSYTGGAHPLAWRLLPSWAENYHISQRRTLRYAGSCAGFVQACFGKGNLTIVDASGDRPDRLPGMTVEEFRELDNVLKLTKSASEGKVASDDEILRYGQRHLDGAPPWRLLLPGYLLKAFVRSQYPYRVEAVRDCCHP